MVRGMRQVRDRLGQLRENRRFKFVLEFIKNGDLPAITGAWAMSPGLFVKSCLDTNDCEWAVLTALLYDEMALNGPLG